MTPKGFATSPQLPDGFLYQANFLSETDAGEETEPESGVS